ncbi:unnamed protein product [Meloidogyne enterolobii]|uniref:Uncharacterized protein n=1 Tax=Meloidogyne enterolobii TaxID=390850 RepID=A0ACB1AN42_MELEN
MIIYIQRLILTIDTRAGKGLRRVAINGLKDVDGKPVTEGQRIGSQHSAWDTWILEEWKSNVYSSELQKLTRYIFGYFGLPFPPLLHFNCFQVLVVTLGFYYLFRVPGLYVFCSRGFERSFERSLKTDSN